MDYFPDLTDCLDYFGTKAPADVPFRAIGWLHPDYAYSEGVVPQEVVAKIRQFLEAPWQPFGFAGGHDCEFCSNREDPFHAVGNLFIPFRGGFYVAPSMLVHYIEEHNYQPPDEFLAAVDACPVMLSDDFFEEIGKLGFQTRPEERAMMRHLRDNNPFSMKAKVGIQPIIPSRFEEKID